LDDPLVTGAVVDCVADDLRPLAFGTNTLIAVTSTANPITVAMRWPGERSGQPHRRR
jgi:hypothetical protein